MIKFKTILILAMLLFGINGYTQIQTKNSNEKEFIAACNKIAQAFINKDVKTLNTFIHPKTGLYLIVKFSANAFYNFRELSYADTAGMPGFAVRYPDEIIAELSPLTFEEKPEYDFDSSSWNKTGSFIDTTHKYTPLTNIIKYAVEYNNFQIKENKELISAIKKVEQYSRAVLFTEIGYDGFLFYMTLISNKWYLTIIDQGEASSDA